MKKGMKILNQILEQLKKDIDSDVKNILFQESKNKKSLIGSIVAIEESVYGPCGWDAPRF